MPLRRLIPTVLVLAVISTAARATDPPPHPDLSTEDLRRAGPFYFRPYFAVKRFGYDDNVFFDSAEPVGDLTATLSPGISVFLRAGPRAGVKISQEFDYVAFAEHSDESHWNNHTAIRGIYVPKNFLLAVDWRYDSIRERPNLEIDDRIRQKNRALALTLGTPPWRRLGVELTAGRETFRFSDTDDLQVVRIRRLSRDEDTVELTGTIRLLPKTHLLVTGAFLEADFVYPEEMRDSRSRSGLLGLRFAPGARILGEFRIGPISFEALDREDEDYQGYVGDAEFSARVGLTNRFTVTFQRMLEFSTLAENLFYIGRRGTVAWERFLTRRMSFEFGIGDGVNEYPNEVLLLEPEPRIGLRNDRIREYECNVRYRLRKDMTFEVGLTHLEVDSTDDSIDRRRNIVAVGTTVLF